MTLEQIKTQVAAFFPGKCQQWINGKVKEMTNGSDLRKKSTWDYALNLLRANEVAPATITQATVNSAIAMLDSLPQKEVVTPKQFISAVVALESLPLLEIKPNVFIAGRVEPARPLVA